MDMSALGNALQTTLGTHLPSIFAALAIFALGWLAAVVLRAGTRKLLAILRVNARIEESTNQAVDVENPIALGVFWLIILVALVAVFNVLDLTALSGPLGGVVDSFLGYLPHLVAGTILVLLAWVLATVVRSLAEKALQATGFDEKLSEAAGMEPMSKSAGNALFWLVILLFLPAVLSAYQLFGLLEPVQQMLTKFLAILPNVIGALLIGLVGWLVAKVLRGLVINLLLAAGADNLGKSVGLSEQVQISRLVGTLVFLFVFIPSLIAALDALALEAISAPATDMLGQIMSAIPNLLAAAAILVLTYYVARFAADLLSKLLSGIGFDTLPEKLGMAHAFPGENTPSRFAGRLAMFFAMLFATVEAANRLGFEQVSDIVSMFIRFGGDVLLGGVILVIGFWLANLAYEAINRASGEGTTGLARVAHVAIIGLVAAMGLRAMGIADDIVNLAFALTLGSVAVATALSFGLGGREAAGRQLEHWLKKLRNEE